jgi:diaminohydroxyphosphoribosylaminopyrimidine deaminase/5-amino-6-(5-phosphoribosylamino)uracil reductase
MHRAIELAKQGMGHTSPNPMVGCVVVTDGTVISEGYHEKYGEYHAERNALLRCTQDTAGADLYVTLEPCCHYGKTPPCTEIIIEKKIKRVFVGSMDPNPLVAGNGVRILQEHGIEVVTGICQQECLDLNEVFFHFIRTKSPFVVLKYAMTLDGKIACASGDSKWITSETAREHVHGLRKRYSAIMVGIGTVLADDPMLDCRIEDGVNPIRIVCDSTLRIPLTCQLVKTAGQIRTIVVTSARSDEKKRKQLEEAGIELLVQPQTGQVDLKQLFSTLGEMKIDSILVEGGGTLNGTLLEKKLVNRVYAYIAPKLVGGAAAKGPILGAGVQTMAQAVLLENTELISLGADYCITGTVGRSE